jgi:hypothetical protein
VGEREEKVGRRNAGPGKLDGPAGAKRARPEKIKEMKGEEGRLGRRGLWAARWRIGPSEREGRAGLGQKKMRKRGREGVVLEPLMIFETHNIKQRTMQTKMMHNHLLFVNLNVV